MRPIDIASLDDPRVADYRGVKDRQLLPSFTWAATRSDDTDAPWGKFMAEGELVVRHLLRSQHRPLSVLITPTRLETMRDCLESLDNASPVYLVSKHDMESMVGFPLHRGVMAIAARAAPLEPAAVIHRCAPGRPLLILEDVNNHDNIGGLFRNAAAFGAAGILLSPRCSDPLYRKAVRVSMGCVLVTPWAFARDWPHALTDVRNAGIQVAALCTDAAQPLAAAAPSLRPHRIAIMLGAEGPGLSPLARASADHRLRITMAPGIDSLNVSVTGAVALHELASPMNA